MKPKFIMISGQSRAGKSAVAPLLSAFQNIDLPFCTPDLDWLNTLRMNNHLDSHGFKHILMNYILCYSWYSYLGRHINLREPDYYSFKNFLASDDLKERFLREDEDTEFQRFLNKLESQKFIPAFHADINIPDEEAIMEAFPISLCRIHIRRSPIDLFKQWASGNRLRMGETLSRRMQLFGVAEGTGISLSDQFIARTNPQEKYRDASGYLRYRNIPIESVEDDCDSDRLFEFVKDDYQRGIVLADLGRTVKFEAVVSSLESELEKISSMLKLPILHDRVANIKTLVQPRKIQDIMILDSALMISECKKYSLSKQQSDELMQMQEEYLEELASEGFL